MPVKAVTLAAPKIAIPHTSQKSAIHLLGIAIAAQLNEMNTNILKFMFEWGPSMTAVISLIYGIFYARICCVGTPAQKVAVWLIFLFMTLASVISMALSADAFAHNMLRGQITQQLLFGTPPIPLLAGMGLYAWCSPEKWVTLAESRKYLKQVRAKE